jgi:Domain of unknown function (DUF4437)
MCSTRFRWFVLTACLILFLGLSRAEDKGHDEHVLITPGMLKWRPGPSALPPGAEVAPLHGDPSKEGPFTIRIKLPNGYKVPPHWHPTDENVTVLKGTLMMGTGERFDADAAKALPTGGFGHMPKGKRHYAFAKGETILQLHSMGPFQVNYVNPDDDPRKK